MKLNKFEVITLCTIAVFVLIVGSKIITDTNRTVYEKEMSEITTELPVEMDSTEIEDITETHCMTAINEPQSTEEVISTELYPEAEKCVTEPYFESQSIDKWSVSETTAETVDETTVETTVETVVETEAVTECDNGYIGNFRITGYYPEEGYYEGKICASGVGLHKGVCAMNNSQRKALGISYGSQIYIDGLGTFTVADCGCKYGKVDIWCYTKSEAYALPKYANVYIVR